MRADVPELRNDRRLRDLAQLLQLLLRRSCDLLRVGLRARIRVHLLLANIRFDCLAAVIAGQQVVERIGWRRRILRRLDRRFGFCLRLLAVEFGEEA